MAEAADHPSTWILLSEAQRFVAIYTFSTPTAEELLLDALRLGRIRWRHYGRRDGTSTQNESQGWQLAHWHDGIYGLMLAARPRAFWKDRWWVFWCEYEGRQISVDWENSWARCAAPDGSDYKLSLIRLHRGDVLDMLREEELLRPEAEPAASPSPEPDMASSAPGEPRQSDPASPVTLKQRLWSLMREKPRGSKESDADYIRRLHEFIPMPGRTWKIGSVEAVFYKLKKSQSPS